MNIALYQLADQYIQTLEKLGESDDDTSYDILLDSLSGDLKEKD